MQTVKELYTKSIRPLGEGEKLELATLILEDVTHGRTEQNGNGGSLSSLFGSISLGKPTGADNESIDADLAREYSNRHEDED